MTTVRTFADFARLSTEIREILNGTVAVSFHRKHVAVQVADDSEVRRVAALYEKVGELRECKSARNRWIEFVARINGVEVVVMGPHVAIESKETTP